MTPMRLVSFCLVLLASLAASPSFAQEEEMPSRCIAMAQALPSATFVSFTPAQAKEQGTVRITYAGHSTYLIDTPAGVRIATDFSGVYGGSPPPRVATMNRAHRTHFTDTPDPAIEYVLRGWNPDGGAARHRVVVDDVYIRNVPTDIRDYGGGLSRDGNSIFIFEVAGLCIGHLGHLHTRLSDAQFGAIGRLDVVMVPIDGGMTQSLGSMSEIAQRLQSSIVLPMHRHSTPISAFTGMMGEAFAVDFRDETYLDVSLRSLPKRPTILVLRGV